MTSQSQASRKIKRPILNFLWVGILSWLILLAYGLTLWLQSDFTFSLSAIQNLTTTQISFISTFKHLEPILSLLNPLSFDNATIHASHPALIFTIQLWVLLCAITQILIIKLCILLLSAPLFFLALIAGLVDGLSMRAIRTASLGRESTYIFHKSIPLIRKLFVTLLLLWLSLPIALSPSLLFLSLSVMVGMLASLSASRFKKYL